MMLSENDHIISDEVTIAVTMNKHFVNITKKLKLKPTETETNELKLSEILDGYKDHWSIIKIGSQKNDGKNLFSFKPVTSEDVAIKNHLLSKKQQRVRYSSQNN